MNTHTAALALFASLSAAWAGAQSSTATYQVTFEATWSASTHPGAYPLSAHFSPLVGGVHGDAVDFWSPGSTASAGIEQIAETGATSLLRSEINAAISSGTAHELVTGGGIDSPGQTTTTFEATSSMHRLTLVTMIAPSPDWFVGTHGLELFENGEWETEIVYPLIAYDSGTDSGTAFTSPNSDTSPQEPISDFSTTPPFAGLPELGTYTITLLSVEVCLADVNGDGLLTPADFSAWIAAFNSGAAICDQNDDGSCTPSDFTAWIANYNSGC